MYYVAAPYEAPGHLVSKSDLFTGQSQFLLAFDAWRVLILDPDRLQEP